LVKAYLGKPTPAVGGISFEVSAGECFGLLGPNGAGKSTTIECLTGFFPASSGNIEIQGIDMGEMPKLARQHLGVCSQEDTLDTDFTVRDQLVRHATFYGLSVAQANPIADELLKAFDLFEKGPQMVETLSGGMRRKLQVARSMVGSPKVVVLDEPTTGLDPSARRQIWNLLSRLRKEGACVILSTHYMDEAERLCDRIAIINQGQILDVDTPQALIQKHAPQQTVDEEIRPGVRWQRPANLEDVFLHLAGARLADLDAEGAR
jgi:lipooligosaccharide transport system ATP-binding protein